MDRRSRRHFQNRLDEGVGRTGNSRCRRTIQAPPRKVTYLDTHTVIWLRGDPSRFSPRARQSVDADDEILISPMVLLELESLHEIRRLVPSARQGLEELGP